jgi:hypothetical protein
MNESSGASRIRWLKADKGNDDVEKALEKRAL